MPNPILIPVSAPTNYTIAAPKKKVKKTTTVAATTSVATKEPETKSEDPTTLPKIEAAKPIESKEENFCFTCYNGFSCHTHRIKRSSSF